ncbi:UNVERIFIED_CONTAM: hypothetical protein NCL1_19722 [Trichonephila clavipes]
MELGPEMLGYFWYLDNTRTVDSTRHSKSEEKLPLKKRKFAIHHMEFRKMFLPCTLFIFLYMVTIAKTAPIPLEMIDMTYVFDNTTLHWPTQKKFELLVLENGTQEEGYW